jgi:DNA-binding NtrC family response regulator
MSVRALRCRLTPHGDEPLTIDWWSGNPADLTDKGAAGAYVVAEESLALLRSLTSLVHDRGQKHRARALSAILLGQPRIPVVLAAFKSDRQLTRSIRTLLEHAARRRERKAYIVGVPSTVFEQVAARVVPTGEDDAKKSSPAHDLELIDPEEVPASLEESLVGNSLEMRVVRQLIVRAAREDVAVLVQGDTGTGKDLVARSIHQLNASRNHQPFVVVNCGAIPPDLFESQVFGYVPGAFTGALRHGSEGLWRFARGGTIFLDEIGDLAPMHQVKILRVLEQKKVRPLGSATEVDVEARVIAATNRDLYSMKESGEFREDLYYRLASMVITLPPLRERPEDVARLACRFWNDIAPRRPPLSAEVLRELGTYRWRGNAREVRYIVVNLHMTFPKSIPNVERLRAVVRMRAPSEGREQENGGEEALRRVDRLRHLRRARAAIDACQRLVRGFGRKNLDADRRAQTLADVGGCLTELQLLGARPERFEHLATFEATHRLTGGLAAFQSLLARKDPQAARYCSKELAGEVAAAGANVRREEERVLKSL